MSHFWHKPLNVVVSAIVVFAMLGIGAASVSAAVAHHPAAKGKGKIVYSDYENAPTLNNFQYNGIATAENSVNIAPFGIQYFYNQHSVLQPGFYTHVPKPSHGGKVWNMKLRSGLKWASVHNGKDTKRPITNKDVLFAWHIQMNKASGPNCAGSCDVIKSIKLHGNRGLTFHLKKVSAVFLFQDMPVMLPHWWHRLGTAKTRANCLHSISGCGTPAHKIWTGKNFNYESDTFPTTGPYQVQKYENPTLTKVSYKVNPFWKNSDVGAANVKPLAHLTYLQYASQASMIAGASAHQTDATTDYTVLNLPDLHASNHHHAYRILQSASYDPEELFFNTYNKHTSVKGSNYTGVNPVANPNVRLAISLGYNKAKLEANAYGIPLKLAKKYTSYSNPFISTPALRNPFADPKITGVWDPIRHKDVTPGTKLARKDAKKLLKKAGYGKGVTIYITTNGAGNPARKNEVDYLGKVLHPLGITVNYVDQEAGDLFADWNSGGLGPHGLFEIMIFAYTNNPPVPDTWFFLTESQFCAQTDKHAPEQDQNWSCIRNKKIDKAFTKMTATTSSKLRHKEANIVSVQFNRKDYWSNLAMRPTIHTADKHVGGVSVNPFIAGEVNWDPWSWHFKS